MTSCIIVRRRALVKLIGTTLLLLLLVLYYDAEASPSRRQSKRDGTSKPGGVQKSPKRRDRSTTRARNDRASTKNVSNMAVPGQTAQTTQNDQAPAAETINKQESTPEKAPLRESKKRIRPATSTSASTSGRKTTDNITIIPVTDEDIERLKVENPLKYEYLDNFQKQFATLSMVKLLQMDALANADKPPAKLQYNEISQKLGVVLGWVYIFFDNHREEKKMAWHSDKFQKFIRSEIKKYDDLKSARSHSRDIYEKIRKQQKHLAVDFSEFDAVFQRFLDLESSRSDRPPSKRARMMPPSQAASRRSSERNRSQRVSRQGSKKAHKYQQAKPLTNTPAAPTLPEAIALSPQVQPSQLQIVPNAMNPPPKNGKITKYSINDKNASTYSTVASHDGKIPPYASTAFIGYPATNQVSDMIHHASWNPSAGQSLDPERAQSAQEGPIYDNSGYAIYSQEQNPQHINEQLAAMPQAAGWYYLNVPYDPTVLPEFQQQQQQYSDVQNSHLQNSLLMMGQDASDQALSTQTQRLLIPQQNIPVAQVSAPQNNSASRAPTSQAATPQAPILQAPTLQAPIPEAPTSQVLSPQSDASLSPTSKLAPEFSRFLTLAPSNRTESEIRTLKERPREFKENVTADPSLTLPISSIYYPRTEYREPFNPQQLSATDATVAPSDIFVQPNSPDRNHSPPAVGVSNPTLKETAPKKRQTRRKSTR